MATGVVSWSTTAATNATADSAVNFAEGQAPSTVNDSARALMASVAKYRDDISGSIVTGGTSTAYTVTSNQGFASLSALNNQLIAFNPHTTSGATVTLNVDSLGAKPLRSVPSVELVAGNLVSGVTYLARYSNGDSAFYLVNAPGNSLWGAGSYLSGSRVSGSALALTTTVAASLTNITLTPGDWDVSGTIGFVPDVTTNCTAISGGIHTVLNTMPTAMTDTGARSLLQATFPTGAQQFLPITGGRFNVNTNTVVYLTAAATFTTSTLVSYGIIRARKLAAYT